MSQTTISTTTNFSGGSEFSQLGEQLHSLSESLVLPLQNSSSPACLASSAFLGLSAGLLTGSSGLFRGRSVSADLLRSSVQELARFIPLCFEKCRNNPHLSFSDSLAGELASSRHRELLQLYFQAPQARQLLSLCEQALREHWSSAQLNEAFVRSQYQGFNTEELTQTFSNGLRFLFGGGRPAHPSTSLQNLYRRFMGLEEESGANFARVLLAAYRRQDISSGLQNYVERQGVVSGIAQTANFSGMASSWSGHLLSSVLIGIISRGSGSAVLKIGSALLCGAASSLGQVGFQAYWATRTLSAEDRRAYLQNMEWDLKSALVTGMFCGASESLGAGLLGQGVSFSGRALCTALNFSIFNVSAEMLSDAILNRLGIAAGYVNAQNGDPLGPQTLIGQWLMGAGQEVIGDKSSEFSGHVAHIGVTALNLGLVALSLSFVRRGEGEVDSALSRVETGLKPVSTNFPSVSESSTLSPTLPRPGGGSHAKIEHHNYAFASSDPTLDLTFGPIVDRDPFAVHLEKLDNPHGLFASNDTESAGTATLKLSVRKAPSRTAPFLKYRAVVSRVLEDKMSVYYRRKNEANRSSKDANPITWEMNHLDWWRLCLQTHVLNLGVEAIVRGGMILFGKSQETQEARDKIETELRDMVKGEKMGLELTPPSAQEFYLPFIERAFLAGATAEEFVPLLASLNNAEAVAEILEGLKKNGTEWFALVGELAASVEQSEFAPLPNPLPQGARELIHPLPLRERAGERGSALGDTLEKLLSAHQAQDYAHFNQVLSQAYYAALRNKNLEEAFEEIRTLQEFCEELAKVESRVVSQEPATQGAITVSGPAPISTSGPVFNPATVQMKLPAGAQLIPPNTLFEIPVFDRQNRSTVLAFVVVRWDTANKQLVFEKLLSGSKNANDPRRSNFNAYRINKKIGEGFEAIDLREIDVSNFDPAFFSLSSATLSRGQALSLFLLKFQDYTEVSVLLDASLESTDQLCLVPNHHGGIDGVNYTIHKVKMEPVAAITTIPTNPAAAIVSADSPGYSLVPGQEVAVNVDGIILTLQYETTTARSTILYKPPGEIPCIWSWESTLLDLKRSGDGALVSITNKVLFIDPSSEEIYVQKISATHYELRSRPKKHRFDANNRFITKLGNSDIVFIYEDGCIVFGAPPTGRSGGRLGGTTNFGNFAIKSTINFDTFNPRTDALHFIKTTANLYELHASPPSFPGFNIQANTKHELYFGPNKLYVQHDPAKHVFQFAFDESERFDEFRILKENEKLQLLGTSLTVCFNPINFDFNTEELYFVYTSKGIHEYELRSRLKMVNVVAAITAANPAVLAALQLKPGCSLIESGKEFTVRHGSGEATLVWLPDCGKFKFIKGSADLSLVLHGMISAGQELDIGTCLFYNWGAEGRGDVLVKLEGGSVRGAILEVLPNETQTVLIRPLDAAEQASLDALHANPVAAIAPVNAIQEITQPLSLTNLPEGSYWLKPDSRKNINAGDATRDIFAPGQQFFFMSFHNKGKLSIQQAIDVNLHFTADVNGIESTVHLSDPATPIYYCDFPKAGERHQFIFKHCRFSDLRRSPSETIAFIPHPHEPFHWIIQNVPDSLCSPEKEVDTKKS